MASALVCIFSEKKEYFGIMADAEPNWQVQTSGLLQGDKVKKIGGINLTYINIYLVPAFLMCIVTKV